MPELPADFDLKLMPDWLKEPPSKNPYADYEGHDDYPRSRDRGGDDWGGRGRRDDRNKGRPNQGRRPDRPGGKDDRPRRDGPGGPKPEGRRPDRPGGRQDDRRGRPDGQHGQQSREHQAPQVQPANVAIEFFPDEGCTVSIGRQVKSTHRAYSLFDLARMFLARPERHRLKISSKSVAEPLYQIGDDGPVFTDKAFAERSAFPACWPKFYVEVVEKRDPPKGNFTNVARCRANGVLLGPTNYHGYQPALRRLYEERFSRRMSFAEFQREIEVVTNPDLVEQWKQQAGSHTVYRLKPPEKAGSPAPEAPAEIPAVQTAPAEPAGATGETPAAEAPPETPAETPAAESTPEPAAETQFEGPVFNSLSEVEHHFREHYLPRLIRMISTCNLSGQASRSLQDRAIATSVRQAWEQERGFPGQMMHQLRQHFSRAGLHVFKHRKRMQFVSLIRPSPMESGSLSPSVAEIIQFIQAHPNCNRGTLATALLGADESTIDPARKATLATDLRWLIETGRVIEFSDGPLDLPISPAPKPESKAAAPESQPAPAAPAAVASEAAPGVAEASPSSTTETAPSEVPDVPEPAAISAPEPVPEPATSSPEPPASES